MLTTGVPANDVALASAATAVSREVYKIVEVDWDRNGTFSNAYSNVSDAASETLIDRAHSSSLPDNVNAAAGFTSARADVTLGGNLNEVPVRRLFDPYDPTSPLSGYSVVGTPLRIRLRTRTPLGDIDLDAFNGWISAYQYHRISGDVTVTAVDNYDLTGAEVSLPRWAAMTTSPTNAWYEWTIGSSLPLSGKWVTLELLRQMGRSPIREPRGDTYSFQSMIGSLLPAHGYGTVSNVYQLDKNINDPLYQSVYPDGWTGPDFIESVSGTTRHVLDKLTIGSWSTNLHATNTPVYVPENGTGDPEADIGCVLNCFIDSSGAGNTNVAWTSKFFLEDFKLGEMPFVNSTVQESPFSYSGRIVFEGLYNGQVRVSVYENLNSSFNRVWIWTTVASLPVTSGYSTPHEVWMKMRFTSGQIIPEIRFNGTVQTLTVNSNPGNFGYRYRALSGGDIAGNGTGDATDVSAGKNGGKPRNGRSNTILTDNNSNQTTLFANVFAVEWFGGGAGVSYISKPAYPMLPNGKPRVVFKTRTGQADLPGWLYYLPEVDRATGWDTILAHIAGFQGLSWIDEYGTLYIGDASYGQLPAIPAVGSVPDITLDSLQDVAVNPTDDNRRNNVILNGQFRGSYVGFVYEQQGATEKRTLVGESYSSVLPMPPEAIMYNQKMVGDSATPPANGDADVDIRSGHASAVWAFQTNTPGSNWQASLAVVPGQPRLLKGLWNNFDTSQLFMGSYLGANQANFRASGRLLSTAIPVQGTATDPSSIAAIGTRTLSIDTTEWLQSEESGDRIAEALITNLSTPAPVVENLETPGDPRRQVFDVVRVVAGGEQEPGAVFFAQILSKTTRHSGDEYTDTLQLRVLGNPGTALWDSALWDSSVWS